MSRDPAPSSARPLVLRRVLVALDGSKEGEAVLGHLERLLPPTVTMLLLHVVVQPGLTTDGDVKIVLRLEEEAERYLRKISSRIPRQRSRWIVETGDPVERILSVARDEDVDALALTSRAQGGLPALGLGSVARQVVQSVERPVFLVPPGVLAVRRPRRHILVPLGEAGGAAAVLPSVEFLAKQGDAMVTLLHVIPAPRVADPVTGFNPVVFGPIRLPEVDWLDPLVDLLSHHGVRAEKRVLVGEPDEVVLRAALEPTVDLVVLGTSGRGNLAKRILGSVSDQVLRNADRAVLLFHRVGR
jgi:nucleotide-binding universal stress UspA family protein